jgi:hypothetical protein
MQFGQYAEKETQGDKDRRKIVERDESIKARAGQRGWMKYPARRGWMTNPAPWKILDAGIERTFWPASVVPPVAPSWMPAHKEDPQTGLTVQEARGVAINSAAAAVLVRDAQWRPTRRAGPRLGEMPDEEDAARARASARAEAARREMAEKARVAEARRKLKDVLDKFAQVVWINIFTYRRTANSELAQTNPVQNDKGKIVDATPYWDDNKYKSEAEKIGKDLKVETSTRKWGLKKYTFDKLVVATAGGTDVFNYVIARIAKKIGRDSPKIEAEWEDSHRRLINTSAVAYEEALKIWNVMSTGDFLKNMRKVDVTATSDPLLPRVMAAAGDLQKVEDKLTNADAASETHANASVGAAPPPAAAIPDNENNLNNKSDDSAAADAAEQQKADNNASVAQAPPPPPPPPAGGKRRRKYKSKKRRSKKRRSKKTKRRSPKRTRRSNVKKRKSTRSSVHINR